MRNVGGAGQPTLFLHGNPDSSELWQGVIARLNNHYRCLAPDLPGFGRSLVPAGFDGSLEQMAAFIDALVQSIGIDEPLNLVVHDFGGPFGLAWAIKYPTKVKRLAIMNCNFFSDYHWHIWARIWRTPWLGELSMTLTNHWLFAREMRRGSRKLTTEQIRHTYNLVSPTTQKMILRLYRAADPAKYAGWEDELVALTARVPTCVLWGDQDPYLPITHAKRFGAQEVHHFPDCGHWLPAEAPDQVSEKLIPFFGI
ncbi:MAG: alpha/beta hydrolase [Ardenticatenales bacterium]|nr:alpha/beta hydrolase [Ardenticatenales bacterium]